jgi:hypothetical protein
MPKEGPSGRPWRDVAHDLEHETDTNRVIALAHDLNGTLIEERRRIEAAQSNAANGEHPVQDAPRDGVKP